MHHGCASESLEVLSYILDRLTSEVHCDGLLRLATQNRSAAVLRALLAHGAKYKPPAQAVIAISNLDKECLSGGHHGMIRAISQMNAIVRILLESGEQPDRYDCTIENGPIAIGCDLGNEEMLAVIDRLDDVKRGSEVHWLCECKSPRIARMMIDRGIDVNRVDSEKYVGPHRLVDRADDAVAIAILEMFVQNGWNANQEANCGHSMAHHTREGNNHSGVEDNGVRFATIA
jgi:hypothetical protein